MKVAVIFALICFTAVFALRSEVDSSNAFPQFPSSGKEWAKVIAEAIAENAKKDIKNTWGSVVNKTKNGFELLKNKTKNGFELLKNKTKSLFAKKNKTVSLVEESINGFSIKLPHPAVIFGVPAVLGGAATYGGMKIAGKIREKFNNWRNSKAPNTTVTLAEESMGPIQLPHPAVIFGVPAVLGGAATYGGMKIAGKIREKFNNWRNSNKMATPAPVKVESSSTFDLYKPRPEEWFTAEEKKKAMDGLKHWFNVFQNAVSKPAQAKVEKSGYRWTTSDTKEAVKLGHSLVKNTIKTLASRLPFQSTQMD